MFLFFFVNRIQILLGSKKLREGEPLIQPQGMNHNWFNPSPGITDSVDRNLSKLREIVKDRGAWCAAVHGVTKLDTA